ncbi:leucine-rich repeat and calponin homology domain-containing protein 4 isoform X13 [Homo sapiens]|uniref:leucine-rich repeat and calponin homology domain-containing protein 4 isoform X13 n=1 Tax=Homo sapiens TaxID=9606 RepID=UPI0023DEBA82|nr:leucine-rich repeat and calponin homology domain-containing protein 4 isoform X13 [Homo sapiens]
MAAAVAAPLAAGGEEAAATTSVPGSPGLPGRRSAERALEEAVATGTLNLSNRRLKHFPRGAARSYDLSDITQADLSRNRFPEVPEAACQLVSLEGLSLYHNCLRCLNPALGNLTALTYLNLSRNQLSLLPPYICQLPLRVLIVSNNKLGALPPDIGTLGSLRQLDVSSNELQSLPSELCGLSSLRDLNVRRNQLSTLPEELGDLPLVRLDFSCNRVSRIPVSFCRLRHLQVILLDSNPLQSPPAQRPGSVGRPWGTWPLLGPRVSVPALQRIYFRDIGTMVGWTQASTALIVAARGGLEMSQQMNFQSCHSGSQSWPGSPGGPENARRMAQRTETLCRLTSSTAMSPGRMKSEALWSCSAVLSLGAATTRIKPWGRGQGEGTKQQAGGAGRGGAAAPGHLAAVAGAGTAAAAAERGVGGPEEG